MPTPLRGVYLITPDVTDTQRLLDLTTDALAAGVALLQYRNKRADTALRREQAQLLAALCQHHRVPFLVNDDVALAAELGVGVHLGGEDEDLGVARSALGRAALIGASCYASLGRAHQACAAGADYLAFGTFAASPTKPLAARADLGLLGQARGLGRPLVAIGGITPTLAPTLVAAGADLLAVISSVYESASPAAAVRALRQAFPEFQGDSDAEQPRAV
jgi:thiamine-phosphate pyrophosphorylase